MTDLTERAASRGGNLCEIQPKNDAACLEAK
jgi:hypothetical protein